MNFSYFVELRKAFADELMESINAVGCSLKRMHAYELVAAYHGFKSDAALKADGLLAGARYPKPDVHVDPEMAFARAARLGLDEATTGAVIEKLSILHSEERDRDVSLRKRLRRTVEANCQIDPDFGYMGSAFLDELDWRACGEIASGEDFVDRLHNACPYSTISIIASTSPDRSCAGYYPVNPDALLNIATFLEWRRAH